MNSLADLLFSFSLIGLNVSKTWIIGVYPKIIDGREWYVKNQRWIERWIIYLTP